eukprot:7705210-Alexandrium_andersonii.AAC.1
MAGSQHVGLLLVAWRRRIRGVLTKTVHRVPIEPSSESNATRHRLNTARLLQAEPGTVTSGSDIA